MATKKPSYADLNRELESILGELQDPSTDIDQALTLYKRGQEVIKQLEDYLNRSKNSIKSISLNSPK
jgi:exodeoxyribonuclease VII small subunit